jgi:hypothetical protein
VVSSMLRNCIAYSNSVDLRSKQFVVFGINQLKYYLDNITFKNTPTPRGERGGGDPPPFENRGRCCSFKYFVYYNLRISFMCILSSPESAFFGAAAAKRGSARCLLSARGF